MMVVTTPHMSLRNTFVMVVEIFRTVLVNNKIVKQTITAMFAAKARIIMQMVTSSLVTQ